MIRAQRFTVAAATLTIVGLLAIGCSNSPNNPMNSEPAVGGNAAVNQRVVPGSPSSTEFSGRVATIDPSARTMTLDGSQLNITVAANAEVVLKDSGDETPISLDQINPGDSVDIRGNGAGGTNFTADRVRVRTNDTGEHGPENEVEFKAVITFIDYEGGNFTVNSRTETITTDSLSRFYAHVSRSEAGTTASEGDQDLEGKQQITFGDLQVGDTVEVKGRAVDAATIYAALVKVENNEDESGDDNSGRFAEVQFTGMISNVDYDNRIITFFDQPDTVTVAPDAQLFGFQGESVELTFFSLCFIVEVRGVQTAPGHVLATSMKPNF